MGHLVHGVMARIRSGIAELAEPLVVVALMLVSTSAIAQPFYVPSGSMEPTLAIGDYLVVTKYSYGYSRYSVPFDLAPASDARLFGRLPDRGDVAVFRVPSNPKLSYIKRVIGLPGDRIQMRGGHLFLNEREATLTRDGEGMVEFGDGHGASVARFMETLPGGVAHVVYKMRWNGPLDDTPVFTVPPGHLFMMGDNRDDSLDSRVASAAGGVGFVPVENLVGRARWVLGSYDYLNMSLPANWITAFRTERVLSRIE
ncbi:MAG: signal peptidase I [Pseudomonadota bacterium]